MRSLQERLAGRLLALPHVEAGKSRYGSELAFFSGTREIAHFQSSSVIDIRLTRAVIAKTGIAKKDPRVISRRSSSDWVELAFRTEKDVADIVLLVQDAVRANRK